MATVVGRTFRSSPHRDGIRTWEAIVVMLTHGKPNDNSRELLSISGVAASLITDQCPKNAPIVVTCDGPRTRIYCTYDENAMDGTGENEDSLGFDPLNGTWAISLPCHPDDLDWVQTALKKLSTRITARDFRSDAGNSKDKSNNSQTLTLDPKGFLGS
jgi:hypothetical protein